jgi:hypothetical protein
MQAPLHRKTLLAGMADKVQKGLVDFHARNMHAEAEGHEEHEKKGA